MQGRLVEVASLLNMHEYEALYVVYDELQQSCQESHRHPYGETEQEDKVTLADMFLSPEDHLIL